MTDLPPVFHLHRPATTVGPVIFASPHSGRAAPAGLAARVMPQGRALRSSEDAFVGHLIQPMRRVGAPVLSARYARWVVDLNRAEHELDPALIADLPLLARRNPRVLAGLGVIPRVVGAGRALYHGKITRAEAEARLTTLWHPYHEALEALIDQTRAQWGQAILIDMHSMPHEACDSLPGPRPEIVLGDRFGGSAAPWISDLLSSALAGEGFAIRRNIPFAGAYITERYGRPAQGVHVVQVEIDRALYMDEARLRPLPGYRDFRARLLQALSCVVALGNQSGAAPLAAE